MYILFLALILVAFAVLAGRNLKLALTLLLGLLPTYLLRFEAVIPWTVLEALILIAFAVWMFKTRPTWIQVHSWFGPYLAPVLALAIIATVAILWSPDKLAALGIWKAFYVEPLLVFVMLRSAFKDRNDWKIALMVLGAAVGLVTGFAIIQKLTGLGIPVPWDLERRATSVFEYPNALGLFAAPISAALIILVFTLKDWRCQVSVMIATLLGLVAILLAETEAALVAIPAALVLVALLSPLNPKIKLATLGGAVIITLIAFAAVPVVRSKLLLQDYSGGVRRSQWSETFELLKDRPLTGAGLSGYPTAIEPYHDPKVYEIFQYPHNLVLNVWSELGLLGLLASLWLAVMVGKTLWQNRHEPLVLVSAAALFTMVIHGLVDVPFMKNDLAVLTMFFLALSLSFSEAPNPVSASQPH